MSTVTSPVTASEGEIVDVRQEGGGWSDTAESDIPSPVDHPFTFFV